MNSYGYKSKIYIAIIGFIVLAAGMFLFGFKILQGRIDQATVDMASKKQEHGQLLQEQQSYEFGQRDLAALKSKSVQPENLFSRDTNVVKEIKTLEDLSRSYGVELVVQVSGTAKEAQPLKKPGSQVLSVPYSLTLTGSFDKTLSFLDKMEHLPFITPVKTIVIATQKNNLVKTSITADFYIQK